MQRRLPFDELPEPTKRCSRCKVVKPASAFHRDRTRSDGIQNYCRDCNNTAAKAFHADNPEHCRERISKRAKRLRIANHVRLFRYLLEHPCLDCGESDPVVLEFDHVTSDKVANVSALLVSRWEVIADEILKCEVVCANCHRRRTARRLGSLRLRLSADDELATELENWSGR